MRLNLLTADPGLFDELTTHLEHEVGPRLEEEAGSRGVALSVDAELGVALFSSFWVSHDAMRGSERVAALALDEAAEMVIGTVSVEHLEVASRLRRAAPERRRRGPGPPRRGRPQPGRRRDRRLRRRRGALVHEGRRVVQRPAVRRPADGPHRRGNAVVRRTHAGRKSWPGGIDPGRGSGRHRCVGPGAR